MPTLRLVTRSPFSFARTLDFIRNFPPCRGECAIGVESLTVALPDSGRAVPVTLRSTPTGLALDVPDGVDTKRLADRVTLWLGTDHDLAPFYAIAKDDGPMRWLIDELHGLHHVAFLSLEEITVYCVMMQRSPISMASAMKRRFLDTFGWKVTVGDLELRAMPTFDALVQLDGDAIGKAINHKLKGPMIAKVIQGVATLGEEFLRTAPYADAREALLAIPGVGPFSAAAILLRGLGRMDALAPRIAEREAQTIYGGAFDIDAIEKRYGTHIGYWAYYVKSGVGRRSRSAS
ncbi:MAG TPA: hypothetical protein VGM90_30310 [Kofleriaceae bacterium]|jgi:DNA-3-methyladenine glycosylase II